MPTIFDFSDGTNGGANRFFATNQTTDQDDVTFSISGADVSGRESFDSVKDWIARAAELYGANTKGLGNINDSVLDSENGKLQAVQISEQSSGKFMVSLGGLNIGGNFRFEFMTEKEANNFADFLNAARQFIIKNDVLNEVQGFDVSVDTNGGANRFWVSGGEGEDFSFNVWGHSVSGTDSFDNIEDWIARAADLFDGTVKRLGSFSDSVLDSRDGQLSNVVVDDDVVRLGGQNIGGAFVFEFDSNDDAENFGSFLQDIVIYIENEDLLIG